MTSKLHNVSVLSPFLFTCTLVDDRVRSVVHVLTRINQVNYLPSPTAQRFASYSRDHDIRRILEDNPDSFIVPNEAFHLKDIEKHVNFVKDFLEWEYYMKNPRVSSRKRPFMFCAHSFLLRYTSYHYCASEFLCVERVRESSDVFFGRYSMWRQGRVYQAFEQRFFFMWFIIVVSTEVAVAMSPLFCIATMRGCTCDWLGNGHSSRCAARKIPNRRKIGARSTSVVNCDLWSCFVHQCITFMCPKICYFPRLNLCWCARWTVEGKKLESCSRGI